VREASRCWRVLLNAGKHTKASSPLPSFLFMFYKTLLKAIFKVKFWERFIPDFT